MGMLIRYLINILYYPYGNIISILYIYTKLNPTQRSSHSSNWIDPNLIDSISNKQFILTDPLHLDQSSILLERSVLYMATATNPKNTTTTPQGSPVASPPTHGYNLRSSPQASQNQALVGNVDQKRPQDRQSGTGGGQQATGPGTTPNNAQNPPPPAGPGTGRSHQECAEIPQSAPQNAQPQTQDAKRDHTTEEEKGEAPQRVDTLRNATQLKQIHPLVNPNLPNLSNRTSSQPQKGPYHAENKEAARRRGNWDKLYRYLEKGQLEQYTQKLFAQNITPDLIHLLTREDLYGLRIHTLGDVLKFEALSRRRSTQPKSDTGYLTNEKQAHNFIKTIPKGRGNTIGALARLQRDVEKEGNPELFVTVMNNLRSHHKLNPNLMEITTTWEQARRNPKCFWDLMNYACNANTARILIRKTLDLTEYEGLTKTGLAAHLTSRMRDIKSHLPVTNVTLDHLATVAIYSLFQSQPQQMWIPKELTNILTKQSVLDRMSEDKTPSRLDQILKEIMSHPPFTLRAPTRAVKKAPQRKSPLKPGLNRSARFTQSFDKALFRHCLEKGICCKHLYGTCHLNEQCKFKHVSNSEKEQLLSSFPSQH